MVLLKAYRSPIRYGNVIIVSTILLTMELAIRWNHINDIKSSLSTDQAIPFLIRVNAIVCIIYVYFAKPIDGRIHSDPGPTPYITMLVLQARPLQPCSLSRAEREIFNLEFGVYIIYTYLFRRQRMVHRVTSLVRIIHEGSDWLV